MAGDYGYSAGPNPRGSGPINGADNGGYHPDYSGLGNPHATDSVGSTTDSIVTEPGDMYGISKAEYGGRAGLAGAIAGQYFGQADDYAHRQISDANSDPYRMAQGADRGQQMGALGMQQQAAMGNAPSAAAIQQGAGIQNSLAASIAAAHSGRGPSASLAQGGAASAGAQNALGVANAGAGARSAELGGAQNSYLNSVGGLRQEDTNALGIDQARELAEAQMNQKAQLGSYDLGNQVLQNQLQADSSGYNTRYAGNRGQSSAIQIGDRQYGRQLAVGGISAAGGLAGAYAQQGIKDYQNGGGDSGGGDY